MSDTKPELEKGLLVTVRKISQILIESPLIQLISITSHG